MSKKIYVGNLSFDSTEDGLRQLFGEHGDVESVTIVMDRETGRSKGFGFVEMDDESADNAISELDGKDLGGRALRVNQARERERSSGPRRDFGRRY